MLCGALGVSWSLCVVFMESIFSLLPLLPRTYLKVSNLQPPSPGVEVEQKSTNLIELKPCQCLVRGIRQLRLG